jgi:hypothetical protein
MRVAYNKILIDEDTTGCFSRSPTYNHFNIWFMYGLHHSSTQTIDVGLVTRDLLAK